QINRLQAAVMFLLATNAVSAFAALYGIRLAVTKKAAGSGGGRPTAISPVAGGETTGVYNDSRPVGICFLRIAVFEPRLRFSRRAVFELNCCGSGDLAAIVPGAQNEGTMMENPAIRAQPSAAGPTMLVERAAWRCPVGARSGDASLTDSSS